MIANANRITMRNDDMGNTKTEHVPIYQKVMLIICEAAEYSNIGINKIAAMLKQPGCLFVFYIEIQKLVKRRKFENYISGKNCDFVFSL